MPSRSRRSPSPPRRSSRRSPSPRGYASKWSRSRSRSPYRAGARAGYRRSPIPRSPTPPSRSPLRSRATRASPTRTRSRSPMRSRSPILSRSRSPRRNYRTSPARKSRGGYSPALRRRSPRRSPMTRSRSPMRSRSRNRSRSRSRSAWRGRDRSPMRSRSPLRGRSQSPLRRSSRGRSPPRRGRSSPLPPRRRSPSFPRGRSPPPPRGRSPPRRGSLVDRMRSSAPLNGGPPPLSERERAAGAAAAMRAPLFMQDVPSTAREPPPRLRLRDFRPDPDRLPPPPLPRQPLSARGGPPGRRDQVLPLPMASRSLPMPTFFLESRLPTSVLRVAEELFASGMFKPHDITATNIPHLELLPPDAAIAALDEYASLDKMRLHSPPAFFTGIIKRIFRGLPPPSGRPDRTGAPPSSVMPTMPLKRPLSPPRRSPPPPHSRSLPRGPDPTRPPPPIMEPSSQRAPTSWAPISTRLTPRDPPRDRPRSRGRDDYPMPPEPSLRGARSSLSPRRRGDPDSRTAGGALPPPPPLPLPPPPAAGLTSDDPVVSRQPAYVDDPLPLPPPAFPDHIRASMSRRRYDDSPPPPPRSAGGYLSDRHAPPPPRRAPVPLDEYDRMQLSARGLPPPRGSSRYDTPMRHTGFSGPPPPLMDMRGRSLSPPYGAPMPRRTASPPFRAPYGPVGRAPYLAPPPISTYGDPYARRRAYDDIPPPRSSRAPLRSVATIVPPAGGREDPDRRASSLERQQERSREGDGRRHSDREYERERDQERERDGGRREQDDEHRRSRRENEPSGDRNDGRQDRRSPSPSGAAPTGADLAAAGSDEMRGDRGRERQGLPEARKQGEDAQTQQQQEGGKEGKDEVMTEAGGRGDKQGGGDDSQQPTFLDELLAAGDGMEGWENENAEMEEAGGGGDAFDMSNLVDRKQVQKARS